MAVEDNGATLIIEQEAKEMPDMSTVKLRMSNLRLHSSGVFSNVYRGNLLDPGPQREIAIKKTWPEVLDKNFELIFLTGISREKHKNIVQMLYVFSNKSNKDGKICESYVFDFMPSTLANLIKSETLDMNDIKLYTFQLFHGLGYLAANLIAHRDIKPVNLLVDAKIGLLKIGDFGSAKIIRKNMQSTAYQVTRFYRPPELLLGATNYNHCVDIWSGGCVLGEMLRGSVLFPGRDTRHQLRLIFTAMGSPTEAEMRSMYAQVRLDGQVKAQGLNQLLPDAGNEEISLVQRILLYNPRSRLCGRELLLDPWFDSLFHEGVRRSNGQLISDVILSDDISGIRNSKIKQSKLTQTYGKKPGETITSSVQGEVNETTETQGTLKTQKSSYGNPQAAAAQPAAQPPQANGGQNSKKRRAQPGGSSKRRSKMTIFSSLRRTSSDRSKRLHVAPLRKKKSNEIEPRIMGGNDATTAAAPRK